MDAGPGCEHFEDLRAVSACGLGFRTTLVADAPEGIHPSGDQRQTRRGLLSARDPTASCTKECRTALVAAVAFEARARCLPEIEFESGALERS
jgi:hypothetical protein